MKEFEAMWEGVQDKVTETVFRMEEDEGFQESLWTIGTAVHEAAPRATAADSIRGQQDAAIANSQRRQEARADPQPRRKGRPQRSVPVRQRQEVQELPHAAGWLIFSLAASLGRARIPGSPQARG